MADEFEYAVEEEKPGIFITNNILFLMSLFFVVFINVIFFFGILIYFSKNIAPHFKHLFFYEGKGSEYVVIQEPKPENYILSIVTSLLPIIDKFLVFYFVLLIFITIYLEIKSRISIESFLSWFFQLGIGYFYFSFLAPFFLNLFLDLFPFTKSAIVYLPYTYFLIQNSVAIFISLVIIHLFIAVFNRFLLPSDEFEYEI